MSSLNEFTEASTIVKEYCGKNRDYTVLMRATAASLEKLFYTISPKKCSRERYPVKICMKA